MTQIIPKFLCKGISIGLILCTGYVIAQDGPVTFKVQKEPGLSGLYRQAGMENDTNPASGNFLRFFETGEVAWSEYTCHSALLEETPHDNFIKADTYKGKYRLQKESVFFKLEKTQKEYPLLFRGTVSGDTLFLKETYYGPAAGENAKGGYRELADMEQTRTCIYIRVDLHEFSKAIIRK